MNAGRHWLGVTILGGFSFDAPSQLLLARELWALAAEQLAPYGGILDASIPKARAEVLAVGSAHPPEKPAATCPVRVRAGAIDRTLYVIGDRRWENGVPTAPVPFESMPLTWARAFGGAGYPQNPEGRGFGRELLPNVERPDALVRSDADRPLPASFGPVDPLWPQRMSGTYDAAWLENEYPGFPRDLDWSTFNLASREQQMDGAFAGGEPIEIVNMHPSRSHIASTVPSHVARAVVVKRGGAKEDVALRKTTVWLFPEALRGVIVHHGVVEVEEDDAADVEAIVAGADAPDALRPMQHFLDVMAVRTDRSKPERALASILDDGALLPPGQGSTFGEELDRERLATTPENLRVARQWQKARRTVDAARADIEAQGLDADEYGPKPMPPSPPPTPRLDEVEALVEKHDAQMAAWRERGAAEHAAGMKQLDEALAEVGVGDRSQESELAQCGPPKLDPNAQRAAIAAVAAELDSEAFEFLREMAEGPRFRALFEMATRESRAAYRRSAHLQRPFSEQPELRAERRARFLELLEANAPMREIDLSCADLSGLDLRKRDLRGAWLESADLTDADLSGAQLDDAVLARARIVRTKMLGCLLRGANLGAASIEGADLSGVDLSNAQLMRAKLVEVVLAGAKLEGQAPFEAELRRCDLSRADLKGAQMVRVTIDGIKLAEADLSGSSWIEVSLASADLRGAKLDRAVIYASPLAGAALDGAKMTNAVLVNGTALTRASLKGADLSRANLRGLDLSQADFEGAILDGADLGTANLSGAKLDGARARGALAISAVLAGATARGSDWKDALLTKADVRGADLRGASLFGSDLAWLHGDAETKIDGADTTRARVKPQRKERARG